MALFKNGGHYDAWLARRKKKGIVVRALIPRDNAVMRDHDKELREVRIFEVPAFDTTFQIVGDKLILWQPQTMQAVVIEDGNIVKMMRATFETVWKHAVPWDRAFAKTA